MNPTTGQAHELCGGGVPGESAEAFHVRTALVQENFAVQAANAVRPVALDDRGPVHPKHIVYVHEAPKRRSPSNCPGYF